MPWRDQPTPYFVLVSEIMLQQTQVPRVLEKFAIFTERFPTLQALAAASLGEVLAAWSGLGYNRRAKYLWQAAQQVMQGYAGQLPASREALLGLPGVGPNTAGAIVAYAYNQPAVFVETNIRTVVLHHFFAGSAAVADAQIAAVVAQTLDQQNPRQWYWALMDYGTHLKRQTRGQLERAQAYRRQSRFAGSRRQLRGQIVRLLIGRALPRQELAALVADERLGEVLASLQRDGLIRLTAGTWHLT